MRRVEKKGARIKGAGLGRKKGEERKEVEASNRAAAMVSVLMSKGPEGADLGGSLDAPDVPPDRGSTTRVGPRSGHEHRRLGVQSGLLGRGNEVGGLRRQARRRSGKSAGDELRRSGVEARGGGRAGYDNRSLDVCRVVVELDRHLVERLTSH